MPGSARGAADTLKQGIGASMDSRDSDGEGFRMGVVAGMRGGIQMTCANDKRSFILRKALI
jgi:hypothetical protein